MSHLVLRRYTPPTCTLEIMAKNSPLSRWAGQPILKHLRFQLSLDDPKLSKEQWVTLHGDRGQLEALSDVVTTYVQQFLQAREHLPSFANSAKESSIAVLPSPALESDSALQTTTSSTAGIALQPQGLLAHELTLGSLATAESGLKVRLSSLQLFDLANALDDYANDLVALPELQRPGWIKSPPAWGQIAAIALVMIGLSASLVKLLDNNRSVDQASAPTTSQGASSNDQRIAAQLPPGTDSTNPDLSSNQKLPPPPPVGSTVPANPGLPTVTLPQPTSAPSGTVGQKVGSIAAKPTTSNGSKQTIAISPSDKAASSKAKVPQPPIQSTVQLPSNESASSSRARQSLAAAPRTTSEADAQATGTAFDTIPQVAEARQYFEQRWTPPQGLSQTLEYSLSVNANGTIQRITPLGQAAGDYVDRTGIPLVGEPFVSPIAGGRNAKIRVVFSPEGKVQTFLEGLY